jgi:Protein of unknown function (DUF1549)/Protein of unknown function (DUF1553)
MRKSLWRFASRWGNRLDRWKPVFAIASCAILILWLNAVGPTHVHAQQTGAESNAKKKAAQATTRPIPGAGKTVDAPALARIIDDEIALRLSQEKLATSPRCDDSEFIRRVYLDLTGVIPSAEKVKAFLDSDDPAKREKLIDELLADPLFGKQQSEIWMHQLIGPDLENRFLPTDNLRKWLETAFNKDKPWSKIAEELVTASGNIDNNPATMFFVANSGLDKVTGQVSRLFLGVQLQCAQCHNHPFTDWKQDEYWGMAAFFSKVKQDGSPKMLAKNGGTITVSENPPPLVVGKGKAAKKKDKGQELPEGARTVPAKFLAGEQPSISKSAPRRPVLARWLTSPDNPFFARAMVNRMWAHFFGRGFVNPIDDMHDNNPATHPELLLAMAEQLKRNNFSLKYLVKAIVQSETYQRTSKPLSVNEADTEFFSRMYIRTLSAEQLVDSIVTIIAGPGKAADFFAKTKKGPPPDKKGKGVVGGPREQLIRFFRVEDGGDPLEYQDGIPQALRMMNGPMFNNGGKALEEAVKRKSAADAIDHLFLAALARHPTIQEDQRLTAYVEKQKDKRIAYGDIVWTLLNSSEFRLNH